MAPARFRRPVRLLPLLLVAVVVLVVRTLSVAPPRHKYQTPGGDYPHLRMGNPSGATEDPRDEDNFLMRKEYFALSYNNRKGTPNWVSWRLVPEDLGHAPRQQFHPDPDLPSGFRRIVPNDYNGSGFDRGHMCPHSDRSSTPAASDATFVMTNMVPQSPQNNQGAWNQLEMYARNLVARRHKVCYLVAGPQGEGGVGRNGFQKTTPNGKVTVPAETWKAILVLDEDMPNPGSMAADQPPVRLIGVIMPNDDTVRRSWARYRVPVREIEERTGYTFFDRVPAEVIGPLKTRKDDVHIPPPRGGRQEDDEAER